MPELPELKLMSKFINFNVKYKNFIKIEKSIESKNTDISYHGKFNLISESRGKELKIIVGNIFTLFFTMGMSGNWFFSKVKDMKKHSHLRFYTDDGYVLCLVDPRRFAKWKISKDWNDDRGPDPLTEYTLFVENLKNNINHKNFKKSISVLMMDQKYFNGIGNYIRAETLYRADINPFAEAKDVILNNTFLSTLLDVLNESIEIGGGEIKTFKNPNNNGEKNLTFKTWLQCYEKQYKIVDSTNRSFWYNPKWNQRCTYCSKYINDDDLTFNEDSELAHLNCQINFN